MLAADIRIDLLCELTGTDGPCNEICITCIKDGIECSFYYDFPSKGFSLKRDIGEAIDMFVRDVNETPELCVLCGEETDTPELLIDSWYCADCWGKIFLSIDDKDLPIDGVI